MSSVNDVIALGRKLEEAQAKIERADSLEQACAESEARLRELRAAEAVVKTEVEANRERAHQLEEGAKVQAKAVLDAAYAEAGKARAEAKKDCATWRQQADEELAGLDEEHKKRTAACAALEAEETRLAQSVTALKAELEALRARVLG